MDLNAKLKPGARVGPYELCRLLGVGYAGEVHEAVHVFTGNHVALKYLHNEHMESEHKLSRFSVEATTLFKLDHANVVGVLDAGWDDGAHPWMAMELLQGETLGVLLGRQGRLSPGLALQYALDIAWGIDAAHEIGVIHRDLKPDNVFLTAGGAIKVLDFSAAKFLTSDLRTTRPPEMTCTLAFAPPEMLEGMQADARIDVYSLGLMLWQMLAGQHPFHDVLGKQHALITAHFLTMPESLVTAAGLPAFFDVLLRHAVAKPLASRYATMARFAQAIMKARGLLQVEIDAGRMVIDVDPGEPALPQDPKARSVYQAPDRMLRQDTGPMQPAARVALSSHSWPRAESTLTSAPSAAPPTARPLGPLGTIPLPVESVAAAVAVARQAMTRPTMPSASALAAPSLVRFDPLSSRTPEPMATDTIVRSEELRRSSLARGIPAARRGVPARVLGLALLAVVIAAANVTWWTARSRRPAIPPALALEPAAAPLVTLEPDPPGLPDPPLLEVPVVLAPEIATAREPTGAALLAPAPSATATPGRSTVAPSSSARPRPSPAKAAPAKPAGGLVPLFELPARRGAR